MAHTWIVYFGWILAATLLGFGVSAVFSGWLQLSRRIFLVVYLFFVGGFLALFTRWARTDLLELFHQGWLWGLVGGLVTAIILILNVRSQPDSQKLTGAVLWFDFTWLGLVYGLLDALFLNVMPVYAVWQAFARLGWSNSWPGSLAAGVAGLLASLLVTAAYHLGYREFRSGKLGLVLFGNSLITLAYLLPGNPLGAVISHVIMHVAAVNRGPETTLQLPPHYASAH